MLLQKISIILSFLPHHIPQINWDKWVESQSNYMLSIDSITFVKRLIPLRSIRIPADTFPSRKSSLRKMWRLYPGVSRTCQCRDFDYSQKIHHHRSPTIPCLSWPRYTFLFSSQRASCCKCCHRGQRLLLVIVANLRLRASFSRVFSPPAARRVSAFLPLHHRFSS